MLFQRLPFAVDYEVPNDIEDSHPGLGRSRKDIDQNSNQLGGNNQQSNQLLPPPFFQQINEQQHQHGGHDSHQQQQQAQAQQILNLLGQQQRQVQEGQQNPFGIPFPQGVPFPQQNISQAVSLRPFNLTFVKLKYFEKSVCTVFYTCII